MNAATRRVAKEPGAKRSRSSRLVEPLSCSFGGDGCRATTFQGRVEHLVSGHATRFHSPEELRAFFTQVLNTTRAKPP